MEEYLIEKMEVAEAEKLESAIAAIRKKSFSPHLKEGEYKTDWCDCGDPLPVFRKQCGLTTCIECQDKIEKREKLLGRR